MMMTACSMQFCVSMGCVWARRCRLLGVPRTQTVENSESHSISAFSCIVNRGDQYKLPRLKSFQHPARSSDKFPCAWDASTVSASASTSLDYLPIIWSRPATVLDHLRHKFNILPECRRKLIPGNDRSSEIESGLDLKPKFPTMNEWNCDFHIILLQSHFQRGFIGAMSVDWFNFHMETGDEYYPKCRTFKTMQHRILC